MSKGIVAIRAGKEAYARIKNEGLHPEMISGVAAAAGGPKWFTTYGLSRYILGDFLAGANQELHFLGASVGAWQMAAGLTNNPKDALDRLRATYAGYIYDEVPSPKSIEQACHQIITDMLHDQKDHVLRHPTRSLHVITARGKGWLGHDYKYTKGLGFVFSFVLNALSRKLLNVTSERFVFSTGERIPYNVDNDILNTFRAQLSPANLEQALLGSGSIPFVSPGVNDIIGAPDGKYWDGGFTDYHISLPYDTEGLILHPHFFPFVYAGWFDKKLPWNRIAISSNMSKAILIHPTSQFIKSLPNREMSDMKDFYSFGTDQKGRMEYWMEISERSLALGEELKILIESGDIESVMELY